MIEGPTQIIILETLRQHICKLRKFMAHICVGGFCRWTPRRKEEFPGNYQLGHWVEQLQIIRKGHKIVIRIAVADAWS